MKIIDLYNKIANGEEIPEKFKYEDVLYTREPMSFFDYTYVDENDKLFEDAFTLESLNDEIEIIEDTPKKDKKIEKLNTNEVDFLSLDDCKFKYSTAELEIISKINEIINKINGDE